MYSRSLKIFVSFAGYSFTYYNWNIKLKIELNNTMTSVILAVIDISEVGLGYYLAINYPLNSERRNNWKIGLKTNTLYV